MDYFHEWMQADGLLHVNADRYAGPSACSLIMNNPSTRQGYIAGWVAI
jgi:hypothetical protein